MEITRLAGIVIVFGFIIFWVGNLSSPPGVYQEPDTEKRLQSVEMYPLRWALSQGLGGVGIGVVVLGLFILSINLADEYGPWLTYLPAALNILALTLTSVWLYQYITDPVSIWENSGDFSLTLAASILMMVAGILYGILFLQFGLPAWLGYLTIGYAAIALAATVIARPAPFYVIALYFFVMLAAGIVLIRQ